MKEKDIIKILIYLVFIAFWIFFLIKNRNNRKDNTKKTEYLVINYFLNLQNRWYDILFVVGISGIIIVFDFNIILSIIIGVSLVVISKVINGIH